MPIIPEALGASLDRLQLWHLEVLDAVSGKRRAGCQGGAKPGALLAQSLRAADWLG